MINTEEDYGAFLKVAKSTTFNTRKNIVCGGGYLHKKYTLMLLSEYLKCYMPVISKNISISFISQRKFVGE